MHILLFLALFMQPTILTSQSIARYPVSFNSDPAFFIAGRDAQKIKEKAQRASKKLYEALKSYQKQDLRKNFIFIKQSKNALKISIFEQEIIKISSSEAKAMGFSKLSSLAAHLKQSLTVFVQTKIKALRFQALILGIFISLLILAPILLLTRKLSLLHKKFHLFIQNNNFINLKYLKNLQINKTVIYYFLSISLSTIYFSVILLIYFSAFILITYQFPQTKPINKAIFSQLEIVFFHMLNFLLLNKAKILLVFSLLVTPYIFMKIKNNHIIKFPSKTKNSNNHIYIKTLASIIILIITLPILISYITGTRFLIFSYIQIFLLICLTPFFFNSICGVLISYQPNFSPNSFVQIGKFRGNIIKQNIFYITLKYQEQISYIPSFYACLLPVIKYSEPPKKHININLTQSRPSEILIDSICNIIHNIDKKAEVWCTEITQNTLRVKIITSAEAKNINSCYSALMQAHENGTMELAAALPQEAVQ